MNINQVLVRWEYVTKVVRWGPTDPRHFVDYINPTFGLVVKQKDFQLRYSLIYIIIIM
jgi:hypothetical protein